MRVVLIDIGIALDPNTVLQAHRLRVSISPDAKCFQKPPYHLGLYLTLHMLNWLLRKKRLVFPFSNAGT